MLRRPAFLAGLCMVLLCLLAAFTGRKDETAWLPEKYLHQDGETVLAAGRVRQISFTDNGIRVLLGDVADLTDRLYTSGCKAEESAGDFLLTEKVLKQEQPEVTYNISFYLDTEGPEPGDLLLVRGQSRSFLRAGNPGQFDEAAWNRSAGTAFALDRPKVLRHVRAGNCLLHLICRVKRRLCFAYQFLYGKRHASFLAAVTLGERSLMDGEYRRLYEENALAHLLSVSGLHISLVGMCLFTILRKRNMHKFPAALLSLGTLLAYLQMTGWSISSRRAAVMFVIWLGAKLSGRGYDRLSALGAAACLVLADDPGCVSLSAFWLSFCAVASLGILRPAMLSSFGAGDNAIKPASQQAGDTILTAVSLQAGMLPVVLYTQYQICPWGLFVNLLVLPMLSILFLSAAAGGFLAMLCPPAAAFIGAPCHYLLLAADWICRAGQKLPFSVLVCGRPSPGHVFLYYAALFLVWQITRQITGRTEKKNLCRVLWTAGLLAAALSFTVRPLKEAEVTCLDVGQGDGCVIQLRAGHACLIDGGSTSALQIWDRRVEKALKCKGIRTIDWWFISHTDQDHISALEEYLKEAEVNLAGRNIHGVTVKRLVLPLFPEGDDKTEALAASARAKGIDVFRMQCGDRVDIGTTQKGEKGLLHCLSPDRKRLTGDKNQDSMVLMLHVGSFRMLFTGDLELEGEQMLAFSGEDLRADVLKVGHHGSANASGTAFLDRVSPKAGIISCAKVNRYGHPATETVERLTAAGCRLYCTMRQGAVCVKTDGAGFGISGYLDFDR